MYVYAFFVLYCTYNRTYCTLYWVHIAAFSRIPNQVYGVKLDFIWSFLFFLLYLLNNKTDNSGHLASIQILDG